MKKDPITWVLWIFWMYGFVDGAVLNLSKGEFWKAGLGLVALLFLWMVRPWRERERS